MSEEKTMYKKLLPEVQEQIERDRATNAVNPYRFNDADAVRRDPTRDKANLWRTTFIRDTEKILHLPVYNRYADKTQVFSFYKNDDITRRALHVQLVSRVARTIGAALGLNTDLIEAIALGHDIGHTPFGHAGERFLSELLHKETGLFFNHNVHSVRVLDTLFRRNITLQTLDGILCHNGEFEQQEYVPRPFRASSSSSAFSSQAASSDAQDAAASAPLATELFQQFDAALNECYTQGNDAIKKLVPSTLEGCVVRICDMIAYLGKDRQDAERAHLITDETQFTSREIGTANAAIINNLTVDIINNSYGKNYILMSPEYYNDLKTAKKENYEKIYMSPAVSTELDTLIKPMFSKLYYKLLDDITKKDKRSTIWKHHIEFMRENTGWYADDGNTPYEDTDPNMITADYIASMTDDYFIDLYEFLFPTDKMPVQYKSYFEDIR